VLWHLPLSFVEGSCYHDLGLGSTRFWLTHFMLVQLAVLYVWLANGSGGSILVAVLAHAGFNVAIGLVADSATRDVVAILVLSRLFGSSRGGRRRAAPGRASGSSW
jgi:membrane protease YdiL (CAAX protease family)